MSFVSKNSKQALHAETIVIEEFKYASTYTLQMLQDRAHVYTAYIAFLTVVATAITGVSFFFKSTPLFSYLPLVLLTFGVIHMSSFIRLAYLENKYYFYQTRMNKIRKFYIDHGSKSYKIANIVSPLTPSQTPLVFYPLFLTTMLFLITGSICFGGAFFLLAKMNWYIGIITLFVSFCVFYAVSKADNTR